MVVRHIVARVGRSRLVVAPCISCSLRSGVALAPEIPFFAPLSIVPKQAGPRAGNHKRHTVPLALLGLPIAIVVPAGSLFGVVFAGCAAHAASLVPEEHLR